MQAPISNLYFHLFDIKGTLIDQKNITSYNEIISLENMPGSTYFLRVFRNNNEFKTFKIIKK